MAQSPEYPDLKWVPPKSWTNDDRTSVQLIVIHDTEGSSHAQSAEDGAAYDARRTDGTSTHYFVDNNSVVQCVRTSDRAHTARSQGNRRGIQYELCARASFSRSRWLDPDYGLPMLQRAARQAARDCRKYGIPARKLSVGQVADGAKGFCGHADITKAFPQDNGSHTDPGPNFPWDVFIDLVQDELAPKDWSDMATKDEIKAAIREVLAEAGTQDVLEGAAGRGVHNQPMGRSPVTIAQGIQALGGVPAILATLAAYASLEASEIPPTAEQNAAAVVAALEPLPPVEG